MSNIFKCIIKVFQAIWEWLYSIGYGIASYVSKNKFKTANLVYSAIVLAILILVYIFGETTYAARNGLTIGGEIFYFICIALMFHFMRSAFVKWRVEKVKCKFRMPPKRFTFADDEMVVFDKTRMQELVMFVYDVEEELQRRGYYDNIPKNEEDK
jgi:hypothetical protein